MKREVEIDIAKFEAKCKKLKALVAGGVITQREFEEIKDKLVKEMRL